VSGVTHNSRAVRAGDLYAALPGSRAHGGAFAAEARYNGAVAVLTDATGARLAEGSRLPAVIVPDPRWVLGPVASWVYGDPSTRLALLGVTGTNGKTTTTYLMEAGLRAAGRRTGLIGTVETRIGGDVVPSVRTTPEATDLQGLLAVMVDHGVDAAAMEVSSHALALDRVDGTRFEVAAFTNLSQDHLDFHGSMENYFEAKARLFTAGFTGRAVIDVDDPAGARLADRVRDRGELDLSAVTFADAAGAQWRATPTRTGPEGSVAELRGPAGEAEVAVRLPGAVNLRNAVLAVVSLSAAGIPLPQAVRGVGELAGVPGRMERVDAGQPYLAVVDYAHTPGALGRLLDGIRPLVAGRVFVVIGCGGDRDRGKRPLMAAAAAAGADMAFFTSDNPRSEDPAAILDEMLAGVAGRGTVRAEPERRLAIRLAVREAGPGDAVVVAGKGHETGQEFAAGTIPFDDRVVLREEIQAAIGTRDGR
jgi:UDP-N-acetylmuramoyl-L-alanyl-D-glutamate--2,6-diaminopimelate ligase